MKSLFIKSRDKNYTVFFKNDLEFLENLKRQKGIWVIDQTVHTLYKKYFDAINTDSVILLATSEEQKTIEGAVRLYRGLIAKNMKRTRPLISVGGGVTQDVTGFVASTLYRGLRWIYVPTTLLAQADSCIGSKTSLNFDTSKNLIGTFYAPDEVYISSAFLKTLRPLEFYSGFGEIVKLQLMRARQPKGLRLIADRLNLNKHPDTLIELIYDSLLIKKRYIEKDEFDTGERRLLNYGHCFGHALESASKFSIPHGLAVVMGMLFANIIAVKRQRITGEGFDAIVKSIFFPHLHADLLDMRKEWLNSEALFQNMQKDKKRTGTGIALVLPRQHDLGLEVVQDLSREEFEYGCEELKKIINFE